MTEKPKFMFFRVLFLFEVDIQQRWYLTGKTIPGVLLEERKLYISNKEIHNGCAKMQKYIVAGCIKVFLIIC